MENTILEREPTVVEDNMFDGFGGGFTMMMHSATESAKKEPVDPTQPEANENAEMTEEETKITDDIEVVDTVESEDPADESKNEHISGTVEGHGIYYKTKDVAKELGITEQDVRNYDKRFEEYLNVERTASGHRKYTREYIDKLAAILELKRINNYTFEQTKEALATDEGQIMSARDEMERLHKLMELMTSRIEMSGNEVKKAVKEEINATIQGLASNLLTDSKRNDEQIEALVKQNEELKDALVANKTASAQSISELKEQLNKSNRQNDEIMKMLSSVLADQQKKAAQIDDISEQNRKLMEEVTKKKKRWFFRG